ncbi:hypothetical protein [Rubrivivax rivuli]|uniref:Cthe-2314-like HEPN domain-containing protein n=1 Tax=Rubrivivax rivuli TaxID=1862385 RepID=A0A437RJV4_9BURK|nr:hypothetical protein [Rubrivivax rivuli]RVU47061.1 hypothetical protein EOE66_04655 [Rubrivivax rivuli]
MNPEVALQRVGSFIVQFQQLEAQVNEIIVLLAGGNEEVTRILINELEFSKRLKTADVLHGYFFSLRGREHTTFRSDFHTLATNLERISQRRNELVHSSYHYWITHEKKLGLIRKNSRLRGAKGILEQVEEELLPESFEQDLEKVNDLSIQLEQCRQDLTSIIYADDPNEA